MAAAQPHASDANAKPKAAVDKAKFYAVLHENARRYLKSTRDATANLSNIAALVYHDWRQAFGPNSLNWCGWYVARRLRNTPAAVAAATAQQKLTARAVAATAGAGAGAGAGAAASGALHDANSAYAYDLVLVLGPFHGLPAVTLIPYEKGVCGTCAVQRATQLVPDVHAHPNHIACDSASQSEIVVPLFRPAAASADAKAPGAGAGAGAGAGELVALLDMDSPVVNGFDEADVKGLEALCAIVAGATDLRGLEEQTVDVDWAFAGVSCVAKKKH